MDKEWDLMVYKTMLDFPNQSVPMAITSSVVTAIPFFSVTIFLLWLIAPAAAFFAIRKITGKSRYWHSITAMSFVCFLASITIAMMNTDAITYIEPYWIAFYILATVGCWFMLKIYK